MNTSRLQRYLAEFVGTFILVFVGTGLLVVDALSRGQVTHLGVAVGFGLTVTAIIYAVGHVSGAHINPAVTLAFAVVGRFPRVDIIPYWLAQISGSVLASTALLGLFGNLADLGATQPVIGVLPSLIIEGLIGFVLMFVIISVATDARAVGGAAALAIGAAISALVLFAGPASGASLNPARSIGPALVSGRLDNLWIYIVGPPVGFVIGALTYQIFRERVAATEDEAAGVGGNEKPVRRRKPAA